MGEVRDKARNAAQQAKGRVKEKTGKVIGNKKLEIEGELEKTGGKAQADFGDLKEDVKDAAKDAQKRADQRPPYDPAIDR